MQLRLGLQTAFLDKRRKLQIGLWRRLLNIVGLAVSVIWWLVAMSASCLLLTWMWICLVVQFSEMDNSEVQTWCCTQTGRRLAMRWDMQFWSAVWPRLCSKGALMLATVEWPNHAHATSVIWQVLRCYGKQKQFWICLPWFYKSLPTPYLSPFRQGGRTA